ncbi:MULTISPECIES: signal peptidase I [Actinomyces]|uniref:Signal peptidase I n=1 Tax=Actinomyces respiraculi TaxID=2744574 RepID=A0A7T0LMR1_9ACTO|nr:MULTISPECIES: signal peptidase I [Actinomyces]QPL06208.1 signal peptidase I [Actinomyces respiraculi]
MSDRSASKPQGRSEDKQAARHPALGVIGLPVLALIAIIFARSLVVQTFVIPSASMEDTLVDGDRVAVTVYDADDLERGDVVVFRDPDHWLTVTEPTGLRAAVQDLLVALRILPQDPGHHLIKRVIGLPGDHVVADGMGTLSVNGVVLDESYVKVGRSASDVAFDVVVPEGYIWVMGDNRSNSADSRYHQDDAHGGFVPISEVVGVAKAIVWPLDRLGTLTGGDEAFRAVPEP